MIIKSIIIFICLICLTCNKDSFSQNKKIIDSLLTVFKKSKHDSSIVQACSALCFEYNSSNSDTALYFGNLGLNLAIKINYKKGMADCYTNIGIIRSLQGEYDDAIINHLKSFKINEKLGNRKGLATSYTYIGNVHLYQGNYDKAIEFYFKSLKIREELADKKGISDCYTGIGIVHDYQGNYDKAIEYYVKSLKICEELKDKRGMSNRYSNIGVVYYFKNCNDKALEYYLKSLKIDEELGDKRGMSDCYNNIGIIYNSKGTLASLNGKVDQAIHDYSSAIEYYSKSLKIKEELRDLKGIATIFGNISALQLSLAESSRLNGKDRLNKHLKASIEFGNKAYEISKEINSIAAINKAALNLFCAYKTAENYKKSIEFAEIFISTKDSMFKEEKTKALADMEAKYQNEKKQLEIDKLGKEKELQLSENKKQKIVILFVASGLLLILVIAIIIFRSLRITKKQKTIIEQQKKVVDEKNSLLNQQNEEIRAQRDEIEVQRDEIIAQRDEITNQRDLVTLQKEHIEEIHEELTDSIRYAERIQNAVLPSLEYTNRILSDYFILFKPKDIVSGDFYWISKRKNWILAALADCTGHGVPGGFMSMLGISFLNEIVAKEQMQTAALVLDELRRYIIISMQQKGEKGEQKDGMDIAFCAINTGTLEMQFAGANNPVYIITQFGNVPINQFENEKRNEQESVEQFPNFQIKSFPNLIELKGDKQPIGIHSNMQPFTNQIYQLKKGDTIYLMSDGYEDQFGGPKGKKFMVKKLKQFLLDNSNKAMTEQREIIENTIEDWKNNYEKKFEQIDDITVMGIKIT